MTPLRFSDRADTERRLGHDQREVDLEREQAEDRLRDHTPAEAVGERAPSGSPVGPARAPRPSCPDCGTPHIGAAGPHGAILVPGCWCAEDKRKAALRGERT